MAEPWKKVGSLRKTKSGGFCIKIDTDLNLKKDKYLQLQDPRKNLDNAVTAGRMDSEKAESMKAKIPDFVRYDIFLTPDKV